MTNRQMMIYNTIVRDALRHFKLNKVIYWDSFIETDLQVDDTPDGMHLGEKTRSVDIQLLLNYFCNPFMSHRSRSLSTTSEFKCCCCKV
ncbi:hypothetical protein RvY_02881-2 [Ramazzottius varieornatus]|nr:hypothetical protein RvY_02881-2 [Ramazzottius varieornatus]